MSNNKEQKKKSFSLRKLIYNDKYLIIISIIAAIIIWIATSMNLSPATTKTVTVPVKIDFTNSVTEELGIKCYGEESINVDVKVTAKKYLIKDINSENITAKLQTNSVTKTGTHEVPISVTANDGTDFSIDSYYPAVYTAYFDVPEEQEMEIKLNYNTDDYIADGYVGGENMLNESSVVVSGPKSYVAKVSKVVADVNIKDKLSETTTYDVSPKAVDAYGNKVDYISLNSGKEVTTLTIPVLKVKQLGVHATLVNIPETVDTSKITVTYSTDSIKAGVLESANIKTAELGEISFSDLAVGDNDFEFDATKLDGVTVLDDTTKIKVTVTVPSDYTSSDVAVSSSALKFNNVPEGYKASLVNFKVGEITVIGPSSAIKKVKSSNVVMSCDFTTDKGDKVKTGTNSYQIDVVISGVDGVWVYGTYYATVNLSKK